MQNYLTPLAEARPVIGKGWGSFAIADIPRGTHVATFGGTPATRAQFETFDEHRRLRSIQIDLDLFLVGPPTREPGDVINHSCDPACGLANATRVVARRDIGSGEEITYDYAMSDASDYDEFACHCGSKLCRGQIMGTDWQRKDLQARYLGYFSPYIKRLIDAAEQANHLLTTRDVLAKLLNETRGHEMIARLRHGVDGGCEQQVDTPRLQ